MATILTQPIGIDSTPDIGRSGIVSASQVANYIADTLDVLLFGISSHSLIKSAIGARFGHRQPPTASAESLVAAQQVAEQR